MGYEGPSGVVMALHPMIEIVKVELFYGILNLERQGLPHMSCQRGKGAVRADL